MYPRYSTSSGHSSGRLATFRPTFVPRANKGRLPISVWNQYQRSRPTSSTHPPPSANNGNRSYFVSGGGGHRQQQQTRSKSLESGHFANRQRSKSASAPRRPARVVHFTTDPEDNEEEDEEDEAEALAEYLISRKPSAIYRYNSVQFLNSLRNFRQSPATTVHHHQETTALSRHYRMSKDILDSFVRVKTAQIEGLFGEPREKMPPTATLPPAPSLTNGYTPTTTDGNQNNSTHSLKTSPLQEDVVAKQMQSANDSSHNQQNFHSPLYSESEVKRTTTTITPPTTTTVYHRRHPSTRTTANTRPKSASVLHQKRNGVGGRLTSSKSTSKLHSSSKEHQNGHGENGGDHNEETGGPEEEEEALLEPFYQHQQRRSLDQISSIANWERQIRYELEIEKELQRRELDRQREKLASDQRKLEDWDKQLRIELDARERKIRLSEEELRSRVEEFTAKSAELMRREQMISEIVAERLKAEMKFEIEKLRKKFNELEADKSNLAKKEERVKEVEARLHEQVKIVKEKIDSKRLTDIELARAKKELEIVKKENEVLKEKVDSMEDYQVTRFENRAMKGELAMLRESLDSRAAELERDRERWEREQRTSDQKMVALKGELRKAEQELIIARQQSAGDLEEASSKYEAVSGQLKRLQAFVRDHIAKLNSDFSSTAHTVNAHHHQQQQHFMSGGGTIYPGAKQRQHFASSLHLHRLGRSAARAGGGKDPSHQRSVSMDGHEYMAARTAAASSFLNSTMPASSGFAHRTAARGCRLCNDEEEELCGQLEHDLLLDEDENEYLAPPSNLSRSAVAAGVVGNGVLLGYDNIEEEDLAENREEQTEKSCAEENDDHQQGGRARQNKKEEKAEDVFQKIADKVYEKMSSSCSQQQLSSDNLMSRLLSSLEQTSSSPKSTNILQELLNASASSRKPSSFRANLNLDADEHLTLPNYHESTRTEESDEKGLPSSGKQQKPPSLFEEILASEKGNSMAATGTGFLQSPSKIPVMKSSGSPPNGGDHHHHQSSPSTSLGPAEAVSLGNDDNNNRVLSKKPSLELEEPTALLETLPTNVSSVGAPKEKAQLSRSNSAGSGDNSKSESKSDSFEIDW